MKYIVTLGIGGCASKPYHRWVVDNLKHLEGNQDFKLLRYIGKYPEGSLTHAQSPYGFKVHAIKKAYDEGATQIIWVDSACTLLDPQRIFDEGKKRGVFAVGSCHKAAEFIRPDVLAHFGVTAQQLNDEDIYYVGGSVYSFYGEVGRAVFNDFYECERLGFFSTNGHEKHKWDEACMTLVLRKHGIRRAELAGSGHPYDPTGPVAWKTSV